MSIDYLQCNAMRDILVCVLLPRLDTFSLAELLYVASRTLCQLVTQECRRRWSLDLDRWVMAMKALQKANEKFAPFGKLVEDDRVVELQLFSPLYGGACDPAAELRRCRKLMAAVGPPVYIMATPVRWEGYVMALLEYHLTPTLLEWMGPAEFRARLRVSPGPSHFGESLERAIARGFLRLSTERGCAVARLLRTWGILDFSIARIMRAIPPAVLASMDSTPMTLPGCGAVVSGRHFLIEAFETGCVATVRYVATTWKTAIDESNMMLVLSHLSRARPDDVALFEEMLSLWPIERGPVISDDYSLLLPPFPRMECWEQLSRRISATRRGTVAAALLDTLVVQLQREQRHAVVLARFLRQRCKFTADGLVGRLGPVLLQLSPWERAVSGMIPFLRDECDVPESLLPPVDPDYDEPPRLEDAVFERSDVDMPRWTPLV